MRRRGAMRVCVFALLRCIGGESSYSAEFETAAGDGRGYCFRSADRPADVEQSRCVVAADAASVDAAVRVRVSAAATSASATSPLPQRWALRSNRQHLYVAAFVLDHRREVARRPDGSAVFSSVRKLRHNDTFALDAPALQPGWTLHVYVASNALEASSSCGISVESDDALERAPHVGGYRGMVDASAAPAECKRVYSRLLCIDGGGSRGVIPLAVLAEVERRTGTRAADAFDMIAGTSTGAVVAAALGIAQLPVEVVQHLYHDLARLIFGSRGLSQIQRANRLRAILSAVFGAGATLESSHKGPAVLIVSTDASTTQLRPFVFRNFRAPTLGGGCFLLDAGSENCGVVEALMASTAAPPFFPRRNATVDGVPRRLLDGALVANNPTAFALAEIAALNAEAAEAPLDLVVSLGTGAAPARARRELEAGDGHVQSTLDFAEGLLNLLTDVDATHELVKRTLRTRWRGHELDKRYHRLDAVLDAGQLKLDVGDDHALRNLRLMAVDFLKREKSREWHALLEALKQRTTPNDVRVSPLGDDDVAVAIPVPHASWLRPYRKKVAKVTGLSGFFSQKKRLGW
ncbi:acyl transferase/acyl hydrolase/lysophospholipase [Pelagophyceae sp. CCMP2097]|nr:acyl transferase/acyl hydrolase/lysophospholipase [Pelagophyceae sp. CCMP2097]|mmetsp:Transcript_7281/g.23726  ORF Transcript_7281/g.23726 Transcript_7281/m.23726 type:complete len:577 (-) Transcript_7281:1489-3219(-)